MNENTIANSTSDVNSWQAFPAIVPWGLYSRQQVMEILRVSPNTVDNWISKFGLRPIEAGTKQQFLEGKNIICSMRRASRKDFSRSKAKGRK